MEFYSLEAYWGIAGFKMAQNNPFDTLSFNTARNIVIGVMLVIFFLIGALSYEMGVFKGMHNICKDKALVKNELTNTFECYELVGDTKTYNFSGVTIG